MISRKTGAARRVAIRQSSCDFDHDTLHLSLDHAEFPSTQSMTFYPVTALLIFPLMIVMVLLGRRLRDKHSDAIISPPTEGAVFALFGLLLAFTFSGAVAR